MIDSWPRLQWSSYSREISIIPGQKEAVFIKSTGEPESEIGPNFSVITSASRFIAALQPACSLILAFIFFVFLNPLLRCQPRTTRLLNHIQRNCKRNNCHHY